MPISLSRLPTPLTKLDRLSSHLGAEIWIKRDDLTGFGLSGNKVRKLDYLLADALEQGATAVVTTGGIQSNHCRATAVAARQLGLHPILLLRGEPTSDPQSNLRLDELVGAEIHWCTPEQYRTQRNEMMAALAAASEHRAYVIVEGGSNALGALGFVAASQEVCEQYPEGFDHVVVAVGSGGTLAGLAMGSPLGQLHGVAVCDDGPYFEDIVRRIADNSPHSLGEQWEIVEGYQGPGYGIATDEVWDGIELMARLEGIFLDPVYTGKAFWALREKVRSKAWTGRILFWHTGGAFGLFAQNRAQARNE